MTPRCLTWVAVGGGVTGRGARGHRVGSSGFWDAESEASRAGGVAVRPLSRPQAHALLLVPLPRLLSHRLHLLCEISPHPRERRPLLCRLSASHTAPGRVSGTTQLIHCFAFFRGVLTEGEKACDLSLKPQPGQGALIQWEVSEGSACTFFLMRPHLEKLPEVGGVCREAFPHLTRVRPGSQVCSLRLHTDLSKATWPLF